MMSLNAEDSLHDRSWSNIKKMQKVQHYFEAKLRHGDLDI